MADRLSQKNTEFELFILDKEIAPPHRLNKNWSQIEERPTSFLRVYSNILHDTVAYGMVLRNTHHDLSPSNVTHDLLV